MSKMMQSCLIAAIAAVLCFSFASQSLARQARNTTRTSVGSAGGGGNANRSADTNANRGANANASANRTTNANTSTSRTANVSSSTNVNRSTNINVDVDNGWDNHSDHWDHPVAAAATVGAVMGATAAAIGSVAYSVPPSCVPVDVNGVTYQQCGSTWYQPQYAGSSVQYVVVSPPN